jgi:uncharacterized protein (TIGR02588 family)
VRVRALVLAGIALAATACRGPRPIVVSSSLRPAASGQSVVEAVVENSGGGEGHVVVEATLRSDREVVERADQEVALRAHERVRVFLPVHVAAEGSYRLEVTVRYPVD